LLCGFTIGCRWDVSADFWVTGSGQAYWNELELQLSQFLNAAEDLLTATRTAG
jgi:hypothetical protein